MPSDDQRLEAQKAFLASVENFADDKLAHAVGAWSMGQTPDADIRLQAASLGITGIQVPTQAGGSGFDFATKVRAAELLASVDFGFAMSLINTHNATARIVQRASKEVQQRYVPDLLAGRLSACTALTESHAGSDFAAIRSIARRESDRWILNGEKSWIVNARAADLSIVFAHTGDGQSGADIGAFLVPLNEKGVERFAIDGVIPQTSIATGGFTLNEVELPDENLLLAPGPAFKEILTEINGARIYVAAMCCGMLNAATAQVTAYGLKRHTFGKPLMEHQAWRFNLARARTDLAAARALSEQAVDSMNMSRDTQLLAAQTKIHAVGVCETHLPVLLHAMGAEGLKPEYCLSRHLAAVQMASLTDGSTEMLLERVARLR